MKFTTLTADRVRGAARALELMDSGDVWWDPAAKEYVGRAADGIEVALASDERGLALYLASHPNPEQW